MDVENHNDIDYSLDIENPMHVEIIPIAEVVGIEVLAEVLVEQRPKPQPEPQRQPQLELETSFYETISYYVSMSTAILMMLSILGGLILLMVWFCSPRTLGDTNE
jgi:hypothetical protein